jgi:hypothetical protein
VRRYDLRCGARDLAPFLNLLLGLWVLVSPSALGFHGTTAAWVHIVVRYPCRRARRNRDVSNAADIPHPSLSQVSSCGIKGGERLLMPEVSVRAVTLEVHNPAAFENAFRCRTVTLTPVPLFSSTTSRGWGTQISASSLPTPAVPSAPNSCARRSRRHAAGRCHSVRGQASQRRRRLRRPVRWPSGRTHRPLRRRPDQHRRHAAAGGASGRQGGSPAGPGPGDARAVDAERGRGLGRRRCRPAVVTDSVPAFRLGNDAARGKLEILPTAPLLAETIARLHDGRALTGLVVF